MLLPVSIYYSLHFDDKSITIHPVLARQIYHRRSCKMFFFGCNKCNSNCCSIWQILSQMCGFGC